MTMFVNQQLVVESLSNLHRMLIRTALTSPNHIPGEGLPDVSLRPLLG